MLFVNITMQPPSPESINHEVLSGAKTYLVLKIPLAKSNMQPKLIIIDFTGQKTQFHFKNVKKVYYRQKKKSKMTAGPNKK